MRDKILTNLDKPGELERLYRSDKTNFRQEFNGVYPEISGQSVAGFWHERLNYEADENLRVSGKDLAFVVIAALLAGLIAKIPAIFGIEEEFFYPRNISFIVFPFLMAWFAWKRKAGNKLILILSAATIISAFYINSLPPDTGSDTLLLACIHLPLFLWMVLGLSFTGNEPKNLLRRLDFLRYNGDLVVMSAIILLAGGLLSAVSFGLFELIDISIEKVFSEYVVVWGLAAVPILGTYLVQSNPQLVGKVSPVIAKVFTPVVLVTLVIYLLAVMITGKDPYNDREFLLIFNLLLLGVMALILFSVVETTGNSRTRLNIMMLLGLSLVTVIINGIALSAILFRISEWGFTPNRIAVLGGNILILSNLLIVVYRLFQSVRKKGDTRSVGLSIAAFLPIYSIWTFLVAFLFPVLFNFE
ncbi:hypothetical protein [Salegentibacter sp.]|uniref:hypothetical protein n=1 Tax=Salegentibacter sp. TaxID=1903072 RepID=UPI00356740F7